MKKKIIFSLILFSLLCYFSCTDVKAQHYYTAVKNANISNDTTGGFTTDTLFTTSYKYDQASFQVFGNTGEYATIRTYVGSTSYGSFRVYSGQIINYPDAINTISVCPDFDINMGTLTDWVTSGGDTINPFVYCIAWTK